MGHVHVTHLKASTLAGQTARAKGRYTALVGDLSQRVGLVHELRQLRCTEKLFQRSGNRLAVDQVMRHQRFLLSLTQALLDRFLNSCQAGAVLVFSEFANATHPAVAQVINVIDFTIAVAQVHQDFDHGEDVLVCHDHRAG